MLENIFMIEQHGPERSEFPSPQELNCRLKGAFYLLPPSLYSSEEIAFLDKTAKDMTSLITGGDDAIKLSQYEATRKREANRRRNSESGPILITQLSGLLSLSLLPTSAVVYVRHSYEDMLINGVTSKGPDETSPELEEYARLFQWNNPESGGAFAAQTVPEIDAALYHRAEQDVKRYREVIEERKIFSDEQIDALEEYLGESPAESRLRREKLKSRAMLVYEWKEEHNKRFVNNPL